MTDTPTPPATAASGSAQGQLSVTVDAVKVIDVGTADPAVLAQPEVTIKRLGEPQEVTRRQLAVGFAIATFLVAIGYLIAPIWCGPDTWKQASNAYQTVFTAMVGVTGTAVGYYFSAREATQER